MFAIKIEINAIFFNNIVVRLYYAKTQMPTQKIKALSAHILFFAYCIFSFFIKVGNCF